MTDEEKVEKNTTDSSNTEEVHGKLSAEGDEISQAFSKAAGQAKEKAKEITEKASELMTKENLEKVNDTVQQTLEKVESYNKNNLFDKITFGISLIGELVFVYFFWNVFQLSNLSNASANSLTNGLQALGQGLQSVQNAAKSVSWIGIFVFMLVIISGYNTYQSVKVQNKKLSNVNMTIFATIIATLLGNLLARDAVKALSAAAEAASGNFANLFSLANLDMSALRGGSTTLMVFYIIAVLANTGTLYFLYQKLFGKK